MTTPPSENDTPTASGSGHRRLSADDLNWRCQPLQQMTTAEWQTIAMARIAVFVVEQNCPYQELDAVDFEARHLSAWSDTNELLAYLRIVPAGGHFQTPAIGRVLTTAAARGQGLGRPLMQRGIAACRQRYPGSPICVSAQNHLQAFYASLGFVAYGEVYLEDGIPHIDMRLD